MDHTVTSTETSREGQRPSRAGIFTGRVAWHGLTLLVLTAVAGAIAWGDWRPWVTAPHPGFGALIAMTSFGYLGSVLLSRVLFRFPRVQPWAVVGVNVTIAFAVIILVLLFTRWYYSRPFLIASYLAALAWQILDHRLTRARLPLIAVVPGASAAEVTSLPGARWSILRAPVLDTPLDGVVAGLNQDLPPEWRRFVTQSNAAGIPVYTPARIRESLTGRVDLYGPEGDVEDALDRSRSYRPVKRLLDFVAAVVTAPVVLVLSLIVALVIRLDSPGPVLFTQERVGLGGKPFRLYKFRSMRHDRQTGLPRFASEGDDRITRVGRILRKYRLDELPQFWNVLKGEMSLVGPRPEQVKFAEEFERTIPRYAYRHLVPPGLTGWAQVAHGYAADVDETRTKLEHDLYYVKHLSFWLDLHIIIKSIGVVLSGSGAR